MFIIHQSGPQEYCLLRCTSDVPQKMQNPEVMRFKSLLSRGQRPKSASTEKTEREVTRMGVISEMGVLVYHVLDASFAPWAANTVIMGSLLT